MKLARLVLLPLALWLALASGVPGQLPSGPGDWPGWRGPDRTNLSPEKGLLTAWPAGGPKLLWKARGLGDGYSTPSISKGVLYVLGTRGRDEVIHALDLKADGKILWSAPLGRVAQVGYAAPRSTPTVDGDRIYALGSDGTLVCVTADKGELKWKKSLTRDFGGQYGNWAYAESPLIDGDRVVVTPGGDKATLAALNKATGETLWKSPILGLRAGKKAAGNASGYSSAIAVEAGGVRQYVNFLGGALVGVEADTGKLLWKYEHAASTGANCATALYQDGCVFAASSYGNGGGMAKLVKTDTGFKAEEGYFVREMQNHHGGMVLVDGYIYGTGGRSLYCIDFKTGQVLWTAGSVGKGSVAYADGHLIVRGESGGVALVEANPKAYTEKGRFDQPERSRQAAWPHPVIAGGKLYLRDWDVLLCYDVAASR